MELYFVRHGETEFNKHHQLMGQRIDAPLDEDGLKQAHEVIGKLPKDFMMIYSSPLKRAAQTAKIIADFSNKHLVVSQDLRERDFGSLSGKTWQEIDQEAGESLSEKDKNLEYDYTRFGGESAAQVKARLANFLNDIKGKHANHSIVVVTHFGIISIMEALYPKHEHHRLTNSSVHKFVI